MGRSSSISLVSALLALGACAAQTESVERPVGIDPGVGLRESTEEPGAWTYRAPEVDLASFRRFILDTPRVYRGEGASFGGLSEEQVQEIGQLFNEDTREASGRNTRSSASRAPGSRGSASRSWACPRPFPMSRRSPA